MLIGPNRAIITHNAPTGPEQRTLPIAKAIPLCSSACQRQPGLAPRRMRSRILVDCKSLC